MNPDMAEYPCSNCTERLGMIHIYCTKCDDIKLCLECFSCGAEFSCHERIHPYKIVNTGGKCIFNDNSPVFDPWRSTEEIALLEAVERFNLGNWDDVVEAVGNSSRTAKELRDHYDKYYLRGKIGQITRRNLSAPSVLDHTTSISAYVKDADNDIKVNPDDLTMLCYMPHRDDFEKEYNNDAENLIANLVVIQDDDDELDKNLKLAQIDAYVKQLAERKRRRDLIRDYGLIEHFFKQERPQHFNARYTPQSALRLKRERELKDTLRKFTQLVPAAEFNDLISSLIKEKVLKDRIERLQQLQKKGVTSQRDGGDHFDADEVLEQPEVQEKVSTQTSLLKSGGKAENDSPSTHQETSVAGSTCDAGKSASLPQATGKQQPVAAIIDSNPSDLNNNDRCETNNNPACSSHLETGGSNPSLFSNLLSECESDFCRTSSLTEREYILLKTSLLKEQTLKWQGVPLRRSEDNALKDEVKDFMITAGWLPIYS